MFSNIPKEKRCDQFMCDFFKVTYVDGQPWLVGHAGVDDFNHHYWGVLFIICKSENEEFASKLIHHMTDKLKHHGGTPKKGLVDGGPAIKAALDKEGLDRRPDWSHMIRLPLSRGGGKRGVKGSLPRYLLTNMKMSHKEMSKVSTL